MNKKLKKKIESICSQSEIARRIGRNLRSQTVSSWLNNRVPAERVIELCRVLDWKVTPHELRPDLHLTPTSGMPPEHQSTAVVDK